MKVSILYPFVNAAHGGGNQFLKALRDQFVNANIYSENPEDSNVILFNAHQEAEKVIKLKQLYPDKLFVHRMDGLYKLYNHPDDSRQDISLYVNGLADCTIFQTKWALDEYKKVGFNIKKPHEVITNAPNCNIFKPSKNKSYCRKTRLVCTSWSINKNKGFDYYEYLDYNLNFSKYSFTYIGNDPGINFKNIRKLDPLDSNGLSRELVNHDIFITASKYECCSNSLLEAMSCGLPAIGLNSGGTPEIINDGGELFDSKPDLLEKIEKVSNKLFSYSEKVSVKSISEVYNDYLNFIKSNLG
jgi:glycosyltransferase involved in cell wall biosynthesis